MSSNVVVFVGVLFFYVFIREVEAIYFLLVKFYYSKQLTISFP